MANKKWIHFRHKLMMRILKIVMKPAMRIKCGFHYEKINDFNEPSLILYNHVTVYDQFFVGLMTNTTSFFVMSDDLVIKPFVSKIIKYLVNPIPYKKASTDFSILKISKKVINEGGSVVMAPEGNRTYSGKTCYINPTIAKMIRFLKVPVIFIHIEGGFGVQPRFANKVRKGKTEGKVIKKLTYDDYKDLTDKEIYEIVKKYIYTDETKIDKKYKSKKPAEYLERVIYRCPTCGVTHFESHQNILKCTTCCQEYIYDEDKTFRCKNGNIPFINVYEWYKYQEDELKNMKLQDMKEEMKIATDEVSLYYIIPRKKRVQIAKQIKLILHPNCFELIDDNISKKYYFANIISAGVFGKNKMNFFTKDMTYQIKADVHFNALKYVQFFYKYKNEMEGLNNEFLGL